MILLSDLVAYSSSVVTMISSPALMGRSWSPTVFPVLISGPFCSSQSGKRAVTRGRTVEAYGVKCNRQRAASLGALGLAGVVDHGLVVLQQLLAGALGNAVLKVYKPHKSRARSSCEQCSGQLGAVSKHRRPAGDLQTHTCEEG